MFCSQGAVVHARASDHEPTLMISITGLRQGQVKGLRSMNDARTSAGVDTLQTLSLRCVECAALYPGIEEGWKPRYRCDCGGVLDVELKAVLPKRSWLRLPRMG